LNGAAFNPSSFLLGGQPFQLAYNGNFSGPGSDGLANDVVLVALPEPGSAVVVSNMLGLLACLHRRRQAGK
jgi:hypothetical protein